MKKFIVFTFVIISLIFLLMPSHANISDIREGAYRGKAFFGSSPKHPLPGSLYIIVANDHITGFSFLEDNPVTRNIFFDQTESVGGFTFKPRGLAISMRPTNKVTGPNGSGNAKLVRDSNQNTSPFTGYYSLKEDLGVPEEHKSYINIGPDGTCIISLDYIHSYTTDHELYFGKIDNNGNFEKIFGFDLNLSFKFMDNSVTISEKDKTITTSVTLFKE